MVFRLDGSSNPVYCLFRFLEFTFKKLSALPLVAIRIDEKVRDTYLVNMLYSRYHIKNLLLDLDEATMSECVFLLAIG